MFDISVYCSETNAYIPVISLVSHVPLSEIPSCSKYFLGKVDDVISHRDWGTFSIPDGFSVPNQRQAVAFFQRNPGTGNYRLAAMGVLGDDTTSPNRSTQA